MNIFFTNYVKSSIYKNIFICFLVPVFFNFFTNEFLIGSANDVISTSIGGPSINPPNGRILDNWVSEVFILADESCKSFTNFLNLC